jgi:hypothetical protein
MINIIFINNFLKTNQFCLWNIFFGFSNNMIMFIFVLGGLGIEIHIEPR